MHHRANEYRIWNIEHRTSNIEYPIESEKLMSRAIRIVAGELSVAAELNESPTATAIWEKLPVEATGSCWGEEIYFGIPVDEPSASDARADMEVGELGYWPVGKAFCIFFGPTPASVGDQPRAASPVNPIGRVVDDTEPLKALPSGVKVRIEKA